MTSGLHIVGIAFGEGSDSLSVKIGGTFDKFQKGILLLRTCAIWGNDKKVSGFLFVLLLGVIAGISYWIQRFLESLECE
jgi:hypothetical protein